jgi:hypothetical protein
VYDQVESRKYKVDEYHQKMLMLHFFENRQVSAFRSNIPTFHYSIIPCGSCNPMVVKSITIPTTCRNSETLLGAAFDSFELRRSFDAAWRAGHPRHSRTTGKAAQMDRKCGG